MAKSGGILPRAMWRLAPKMALSRSRRRLKTPIVDFSPEFDAETQIREVAAALTGDHKFDAVLEILQGQLSSRATTETGLRCSEATLLGLYSEIAAAEDREAVRAAIEPFHEWLENRGDHADVSALVARALQVAADGASAEVADPDARAEMNNRLGAARDILDASRKNGMERELWHRARFRSAVYENESADEKRERFERYVAFDRGNIQSYLDRVQQILPRWGGTFDEIETFARQSVERTQKMWGSAVYLQIYHTVSLSEDLLETTLDWDRILIAFEESLDLFAPVVTINGFLALAARLEKREIVQALFAELPELRMDLWEDEDEPFEVFAWANGKGPWPYAGKG